MNNISYNLVNNSINRVEIQNYFDARVSAQQTSLCRRFAEHCNRYWRPITGIAGRSVSRCERRMRRQFECDDFVTLYPAERGGPF
ncbi:hypothetical protein [Paraburkholderia sp. BL10I2N1]|uniref:hypothetical protein n=1 Tax=Paraburkholderia sp. BL10I2N1 TaxID=1938796 RepID=UPI00105FC14C|nr:hypothetical protein [Paraburkholderia sp. BL10I2N1]